MHTEDRALNMLGAFYIQNISQCKFQEALGTRSVASLWNFWNYGMMKGEDTWEFEGKTGNGENNVIKVK